MIREVLDRLAATVASKMRAAYRSYSQLQAEAGLRVLAAGLDTAPVSGP